MVGGKKLGIALVGWFLALAVASPINAASTLELIEQGKVALSRGDKNAALEAFTTASNDSTVAPNIRSDALALRGGVLADMQQCDLAMVSFKEALDLNRDNFIAHFGVGVCLVVKKDYEAAISSFDTGIKLNASGSFLYERRGQAYMQLGRLDQAQQDFDTAIRLRPISPLAYLLRGSLFAVKKEPAKAEADFTQVITQNPKVPLAYAVRGGVRVDLNRLEEAEKDFEEALRLEPELALAFFGQGAVAEKRGQLEEARRKYAKSYAVGGRLSELLAAMQRLGMEVPTVANPDPLPPAISSTPVTPQVSTGTAVVASPYAAVAPVKSGTASGLVASAQEILTQLGYKPGKANGIADSRTVEAIKLYQKDNGLPQTGEVTPLLLDHLTAKATGGKPAVTAAVASSSASAIPSMPKATTGGELSAQDIYAKVAQAVYTLIAVRKFEDFKTQTDQQQGSAVAVGPSYAVTNCHVVKDRSVLLLVRGNEPPIPVKLDKADEASDRCWLKTETAVLSPIRGVRAGGNLVVGEKAYTIGAPRGLDRSLGEGLISGIRQKSGLTVVQTTAPISSGSSGGGLFDARGNLIGITTFRLIAGEGLNFAISADQYWQ